MPTRLIEGANCLQMSQVRPDRCRNRLSDDDNDNDDRSPACQNAKSEIEFIAAVVALGGTGQDLADQARVQQQVAAAVVELRLFA